MTRAWTAEFWRRSRVAESLLRSWALKIPDRFHGRSPGSSSGYGKIGPDDTTISFGGRGRRLRVTVGNTHGFSTRTTSAPQRPATSHMRSPKTPFTPMTTASPGLTKFTNAASIPAEPVALIGKVNAFDVCQTARSRSEVSSSSAMKSGSR